MSATVNPDQSEKQDQQLLDAMNALREQIATLSERVSALEAALPKAASEPPAPIAKPASPTAANAPAAKATAPTAAPVPEPPQEPIDEELLLVISAAIAAFLGKRPHIRQIRLLHTGAWAQQGRVSIQASHSLPVRHEQ